MNRFGGRFASGMKRGVGGGRFTSAVWVWRWAIHHSRPHLCLSLSLARCLSCSLSLLLTLTLARSQSPSHTHRRFGSHSLVVSFCRFDGGIEGSEPHLRAFPVGVTYLRRKLPPRPALDTQIRSEKKKKKKKEACKNLPDFGQISSDSGKVSPGITAD
jgi:hypothetical protein